MNNPWAVPRFAVGIALTLIFCSFPAISRAKTSEIELQVWLARPDRGVEAVFRLWEKRHPGWTVVSSIYRSTSGDSQRLMTAIAGGDPPQLVMQDRFSVGEWASRGAFLALDKPLAEAGIKQTDFYPSAWTEASYLGKVYAVPFDVDCRALFINCDAFRQAGFVDHGGRVRPPRDWDELRQMASTLTKRDKNHQISRLGFAPNYRDSWLYLYAFLNGGELLGRDGRTVTMDDPKVVDALGYMSQVYNDAGGRSACDAFLDATSGDAVDPFLNQRVAMKVDGNWFLDVVAEYAPEMDFMVVPMPAPKGKPSTTWGGGFSFALPETAHHQTEAFDLVRFLVSEEGYRLWHKVNARYYTSRGRGYIPLLLAQPKANQEVLDSVVAHDVNVTPGIAKALRTFIELLPTSHSRPVSPIGQYLWDEQVRAIDLATLAGEDPRIALKDCGAKVQQDLDRVRADQSGASTGVIITGRTVAVATIVVLALAAGILFLFQRRFLHRSHREQLSTAAGFLSPWILGFGLLTAGPVVASFIYSFCRYDALHPAVWIGLKNYERMFSDELFWRSLANTAYMLIGVPLSILLGLGIALLLNGEVRGMKVYRTCFYLPSIVPVVASSVLWLWVLAPTNGLINSVLQFIGIHDPPLWISSPSWGLGSKAALILMMLWGAGGGMLIWLAGLKAIPRQLYEAAELDGCGPVRRFFHVTLPLISPYIFFNLIIGVVGTLQIFTQALVMTQGGPADSTLFYALYLFNSSFRYFELGYASALGWVLMLIALVLTALQLWVGKRWVHYDVA